MEFTVGRIYDHAESPPVVLPESSPSVTPGSLSTAELAREMAGTPSRTDIADAGTGLQLLGLSGTQQLTGGQDPDPDSTTPLQALGAFFTPSGMFTP